MYIKIKESLNRIKKEEKYPALYKNISCIFRSNFIDAAYKKILLTPQ